jgi:FKBP-type peptidyl-prolyl cis-trans isomerase FkpA
MMKKIFFCVLSFTAMAGHAFAQQTFTKTAKGAQYTILKPGNGEKIKVGDVITFQMTQKTDKDSVLGSTYQMGQPAMAQVQPSKSVGDLMDVFSALSVNDSVLIKVPTDTIFAGNDDKRPPFLPKGSFVNFWVKIEKTQSLESAIAERNAKMEKERAERASLAEKMKGAEAAIMAKYIADRKLTPQTTASGLKYVITQASTGKKPKAGDTLMVNYAGRTPDGKLFDSSIAEVAQAAGLQQPGRNYEPFKFVVGNSEVIRGWDEGFLLLNEGSKATLIIPSALGYGERGAGEDIIPYSPLVFDVELIKIIPGKPKPVVKATAKGKKPAVKKTTTKKPVAKKKVTKS